MISNPIVIMIRRRRGPTPLPPQPQPPENPAQACVNPWNARVVAVIARRVVQPLALFLLSWRFKGF